ncbi:hypothetical protein K2173_015877 [Erythroxylum novogranatense]|uniref:RING-type domain-containing protein n=1 Tax=Erythroxylum novogranatense TaxID=1862640 RepID=A0AAV8SEN2_9ROSI|nr:hypothetical protein K2173_015877 [Erythroxylum novogranatense]
MHLSDCTIQQAQPETDLEEIGLKFLTFQSQDVVEPSADVSLRSTVESQPVDSEKLTASDVIQRGFQSENKHDSDSKSTSELSHGMSAPFPDKIRFRVSENESEGGNLRTTDEQSSTKPQTGEPSQTQLIMPAKSNKISSDTITRSRDQNAPAQEDYAKAVTTKQRETPPPSDHDKKKQKEKKFSKERMDSTRSKDSTTLPARMTSSEQQESPIMSSSTFRQHHIKWVGFDTATREELGERCFLCAEDLAISPVPDEFGLDFHNFPDAAVLSCNHAFHTQCLQFSVSEELMIDPQCVGCLS